MLHKKGFHFLNVTGRWTLLSICRVSHFKNLQLQCSSSRQIHTNCTNSNNDGGCITVCSVLKRWIDSLTIAGVPEPRQSVELITAHVLDCKMIHQVPARRLLDKTEVTKIDELCRKRLDRVPVQYIIGEWDFIDLTLKMRSPVFIPRPETENLAKLIHSELESTEANGWVLDSKPRKMLEIGCGSGAVSIYLLSKLKKGYKSNFTRSSGGQICTVDNRPVEAGFYSCLFLGAKKFEGIAIDVNPAACQLTWENARRLGLDDRLMVLSMDPLTDISSLEELSPIDVLISNPPYVPHDEIKALPPEITRYEDIRALDGGLHGMDTVRRILEIARKLLAVKGCLWLEVDSRHPSIIKQLVEIETDLELEYTRTYKDFAQRERICQLTRIQR